MLQRLSSKKNYPILALIVAFTLCFGLIILCLPTETVALSQDMLLSGRYGPLWLDLSGIVIVCAGDGAAQISGFRLLALLTHVANTLLLWFILQKIKPQRRIVGTLLYAWNPVVLLTGIAYIHSELVTLFFILLALLFLQRESLLSAWICIVLAALTNPFCFLLLPLFFRLIVKKTYYSQINHYARSWLVMLATALLLLLAAYGPYWPSWGISGLMASLETTFRPHNAFNSLDAAILTLPLQLSPFALWLIAPQHWSIGVLVLVGLFLLFSLWFVNNLELTLLCSCWVSLLLLLLTPIYYPWYSILPLTLALCTSNKHTFQLTVLLQIAALFSYGNELWRSSWTGLGLVVVLLPFLLWGWLLFFSTTWQMAHAASESPSRGRWSRLSQFSRPPWLSRPPRPYHY